jgi:hypothetical protein
MLEEVRRLLARYRARPLRPLERAEGHVGRDFRRAAGEAERPRVRVAR